MPVMYRVLYGKIKAKEIIKTTEKMVFFMSPSSRERREAKRSEYQNWFDTWEEAKQFLVDQAQRKVDSLRMQLERAKGELGNIKGMKPPQEGE